MGEWGSDDVLDLSGLPYGQLWRLVKNGVFGDDKRGVGSGARLSFSDEDVLVAAVLNEVSVFIGRCVGRSRLLSGPLADEVATAVRARTSDGYLLVDGDGVRMVDSVLDGIGSPWLMVDVALLRLNIEEQGLSTAP